MGSTTATGASGETPHRLMNADDMRQRGFTERDVDLTSHHGEEERIGRFMVLPYDIPQGCLGAFSLRPTSSSAGSTRARKPTPSKSIIVSMARSETDASG